MSASIHSKTEPTQPTASAAKRRWRRAAVAATLALTAATSGVACSAKGHDEANSATTEGLDLAAFMQLYKTVVGWGWEAIFDGVWTNWYHQPKAVGLIQLSMLRERITRQNLFDTYPAGVRTKYLSSDYVCPPATLENRT